MDDKEKGERFDWDALTGDLPAGTDPLKMPLDRYGQLPRNTRLFLERLNDKDLEIIVAGLRTIRVTRTLYRFSKRLALWIVSVFAFTIAFGKQMGEFWATIGFWFHSK